MTICLSFMTVDRLSKQFSQSFAFAQYSTELDMCVVGRGVHSSGSRKQHLLKAVILTCPQGSQSSHLNFTPPSTSFTPNSRADYGAPTLKV